MRLYSLITMQYIMEEYTPSIPPTLDRCSHPEILTRIPSDPTNGAYIDEIGTVPIDIACVILQEKRDFSYYAKAATAARDAGLKAGWSRML